jgi:hypothetical protein
VSVGQGGSLLGDGPRGGPELLERSRSVFFDGDDDGFEGGAVLQRVAFGFPFALDEGDRHGRGSDRSRTSLSHLSGKGPKITGSPSDPYTRPANGLYR